MDEMDKLKRYQEELEGKKPAAAAADRLTADVNPAGHGDAHAAIAGTGR